MAERLSNFAQIVQGTLHGRKGILYHYGQKPPDKFDFALKAGRRKATLKVTGLVLGPWMKPTETYVKIPDLGQKDYHQVLRSIVNLVLGGRFRPRDVVHVWVTPGAANAIKKSISPE